MLALRTPVMHHSSGKERARFALIVIVLAVFALTAAAIGLVVLGSRVTALPYDPDYDTRHPIY